MKNIKKILKNIIHKIASNEDNATVVGASTARPPSKARLHIKTILITLPILLLLIAAIIAIGITNAANSTTEPETNQTFNEDGDGYYIWVRAVDHAGNKGPWSEAQRVWIDTKPPIVTCTEANRTLTITEGDVVTLADYFTVDPNGKNTNIIKTCTIDGTKYETSEDITEGTYTVTCTAAKETGLSADATMLLVVESAFILAKTTEFTDSLGNTYVVPGGFGVRTDLATTVDNGIVIEDSDGNQFVWIPIGDVIKSDGTIVNIELGRYTFNETDGTPELKQSANNYTEVIEIQGNNTTHQELTESRVGTYPMGLNSTALNLEQFIKSSKINKGYYMARYESSNLTKGNSKENVVPAGPMDQPVASNAARAMYSGNEYVVSDLPNSYAWDTAIVFIQRCSQATNYANQVNEFISVKNTGTTSDVVCNIYDMNGNLMEWNTEYAGVGSVVGSRGVNTIRSVCSENNTKGSGYRNSLYFPFVIEDTDVELALGFRVLMYVI